MLRQYLVRSVVVLAFVFGVLLIPFVWTLECIALCLGLVMLVGKFGITGVIMSRYGRIILGCGILSFAFFVVVKAIQVDTGNTWGGFWLNAGTELAGIGITLLVIDLALALIEIRSRAHRIALAALDALERTAWVWLGPDSWPTLAQPGRVIRLLEAATEAPIANNTRELLTELGSKAAYTKRVEKDVMRWFPNLRQGLGEIEKLFLNNQLSSTEVAEHLRLAVYKYANTLGLSTRGSAPLPDGGEDAQEGRFSSRRHRR